MEASSTKNNELYQECLNILGRSYIYSVANENLKNEEKPIDEQEIIDSAKVLAKNESYMELERGSFELIRTMGI